MGEWPHITLRTALLGSRSRNRNRLSLIPINKVQVTEVKRDLGVQGALVLHYQRALSQVKELVFP